MNIIEYSGNNIDITLLDAQGNKYNLTGATSVTVTTSGAADLTITATVVDAANGLIRLPLTRAQRTVLGGYQYNAVISWGATQITAKGEFVIENMNMPQVTVIQNDSPSLTLQSAGHDFSGETVTVKKGTDPTGTLTAIDGTITAPGAGGNDTVDIVLSAVDTASKGTFYLLMEANGLEFDFVELKVA